MEATLDLIFEYFYKKNKPVTLNQVFREFKNTEYSEIIFMMFELQSQNLIEAVNETTYKVSHFGKRIHPLD